MVVPISHNNYRVYVIDRPADLIIDGIKGYRRLRKKLRNKVVKQEQLKVFVPLLLFNEVIQETVCGWGNFNMSLLIWRIKRIIKKERIEHDKLILWSFSPLHWKVMKKIPAKRRIYGVEDEYCYDQQDNLVRTVYNAERKMSVICDDIICASEKLKEKFEKFIPEEKIHLISVPADERSLKKCDVKKFSQWDKIPPPKLVIFGLIRYQTDLTLIERIALKMPEVSIVFIGKNQSKKFGTLLASYKNIYHLGFLSRENVIYCLRSAVMGLYPAKKYKFSTYANPIRIYEYAAAGIPSVSINISREPDYPKSIVLAESHTEFVKAVQNILTNGISKEEKNELIDFAKKHSAENIVKKYLGVFEKGMSE